MYKYYKKAFIFLLSGSLMLTLGGCGSSSSQTTSSAQDKSKDSVLDPDNPTTITVWNYYNGDQLASFESLVSDFNSTLGTTKGIIVTSISQGSIENLSDSLLDSINEKVGAADLPNLACIYGDTAYILEQEDALTNLDDYFTEEELSQYISGFIEEGRLTQDGELVLFPISKSTECFAINTTDWSNFEAATGISITDLNSLEDLTEISKQYYIWTDSLTPDIYDDGKALYGRDSVPNYVFIGTKQLGHEMFVVTEDGVTTDLDHDTFKTLWDNYYIPFINGYFTANASYRSEDMKTGAILALTASTSSSTYLPAAVTDVNDVSHDISIEILPQLAFKDAVEDVAVQQGAGYCVLKTNEAEQYASAEFLKWFTQSEQNLAFSVGSGYSPVTIESNDTEKIKNELTTSDSSSKEENILNSLIVSSDIFLNHSTYTNKPFDGSKEIRDLISDALTNASTQDRAAVLESISQGTSHEDAVAPYTTDEYFEAWFSSLCEQINTILK